MRYKLSASLVGVALTVVAVVAGGSCGAAASPVAPLTSPIPTSTPGPICPAVVPISADVTAVTASSVTISYSLFGGPPCGYDPPITFAAFASREAADNWSAPVATAMSGPLRDGTVNIEGLKPDTVYWVRASVAGKPERYLLETARTAPANTCPASLPLYAKGSSIFHAPSKVVINYSVAIGPPCGYDSPISFTLFANYENARNWVKPVAEEASDAQRHGTVTVKGLTADTTYWVRASVAGKPDPYLLETVRTARDVICPDVDMFSMSDPAATATSATFGYHINYRPPCGYDPPIIVNLFTSRENAASGRQPVAQAVPKDLDEEFGQLTITGLSPDTTYWYRASALSGPDPLQIGSVRTAPQPECSATVVIESQWDGGFFGTVAVRNTGDAALNGWRVAWQWPGDQKFQALWNAVGESSGADVVVRNAPHNARLEPGSSTTFGMVVQSSAPPGSIRATCSR